MTNEQILRDALQLIVDRFGPCEADYIFSKRAALQKARAVLSATGAAESPAVDAVYFAQYAHSKPSEWVEVTEEAAAYFTKTRTLYTAPSSPTPAAEDVTGAADEPFMWLEAEQSARNCDPRDVFGKHSMLYSTRMSMTKPDSGNPCWPLYLRPAPALPVVAESVPAKTRTTCGCSKCLNASGETVDFLGAQVPVADMRMVLCATCGNKRCPHAADCALACTDSNEPGQPGSNYPAPAQTAMARAPAPEMIDQTGNGDFVAARPTGSNP